METSGHQRLKEFALAYLRSRGAHAAAFEVSCPIARFRLDAAGYIDPPPRRTRHATSPPPPPRTIIIECKRSRADFLRDNRDIGTLMTRRGHLESVRRSIEVHRIPAEEPELRRVGSSLFPELDEWDYESSRLQSYRRTLRLLERLDAKLHGQTKFHLISRYRLADECYLVAPAGMIHRVELPPGWGLLECSARWLEGHARADQGDNGEALRLAVAATSGPARHDRRQRLLRNIAVAASYTAVPRRVTDFRPA